MAQATSANFRVTFAGQIGAIPTAPLTASRVSQLALEIEPSEIARGAKGDSVATRQPALPPQIQIEIPLSSGASHLESWWREVNDAAKPLTKRTVEITVTDNEGNALHGFRLKRAWPCGWGLSPITRVSSPEGLTEFFSFVCEELEEIPSSILFKARQTLNSTIGKPTSAFPISKNPEGFQFGERIFVTGNEAFLKVAKSDLTKISSIPSGVALLESINASKHRVEISECERGQDHMNPGEPANPNLYNGLGADTQVVYHPKNFPMYDTGSHWDRPPTVVTLAHELTHASHAVNGDLPGNITIGPKVPAYERLSINRNLALEERRTVGLPSDSKNGFPDFSKQTFSENSIREELGEPLRTSYLDPAGEGNLW